MRDGITGNINLRMLVIHTITHTAIHTIIHATTHTTMGRGQCDPVLIRVIVINGGGGRNIP